MNLLLVEDDLDLGNGVRIALANQGMDVVWVRRLDDALRTPLPRSRSSSTSKRFMSLHVN